MADGGGMTFVVTDNCIRCKFMDCVEVCPVDCFHEGENMLAIHPDECIDCGVCEPECPASAIYPDSAPGLDGWLELNAEYSAMAEHRGQTGTVIRCDRVRRRAKQARQIFLS